MLKCSHLWGGVRRLLVTAAPQGSFRTGSGDGRSLYLDETPRKGVGVREADWGRLSWSLTRLPGFIA